MLTVWALFLAVIASLSVIYRGESPRVPPVRRVEAPTLENPEKSTDLHSKHTWQAMTKTRKAQVLPGLLVCETILGVSMGKREAFTASPSRHSV